MIIPNGTISFKATSASPVVKPADLEWGDPVPCQILATERNDLAAANGTRSPAASYQVLLDELITGGRKVRLEWLGGISLGVFTVKRMEYWAAVCQTSLWVQ